MPWTGEVCIPVTSNSDGLTLIKSLWVIASMYLPLWASCYCCSVAKVLSGSLQPHGLQHARLPCHHHLPKLAQTHVHQVSNDIQPSHPLSSPSPPAFNLSQHQGLFQWAGSSHQVVKVLELQHQSFQWIFRTDCQDWLVWTPCCPVTDPFGGSDKESPRESKAKPLRITYCGAMIHSHSSFPGPVRLYPSQRMPKLHFYQRSSNIWHH